MDNVTGMVLVMKWNIVNFFLNLVSFNLAPSLNELRVAWVINSQRSLFVHKEIYYKGH